MHITKFMNTNFKHFNSATLRDSAVAYKKHIATGGKMLVTLAGAMSTAELGISLAEMIRQDKVHAISCTGANLEEDLFFLVAAKHYVNIPNWRNLSPQEDYNLWKDHLNRVTDVAIPEAEAFRILEDYLVDAWTYADTNNLRYFPHEYFYQIIQESDIAKHFQNDPKNSWLLAACEKNLPIFVPGAEDSTTGNYFAGRVMLNKLNPITMKSGMEYMSECIQWYIKETANSSMGMFQIGGGIAGDFVACVVPTIRQDFRGILPEVPFWGYFCQITDAVTSYGGFSGCTASEKISWGKLALDTPNFTINSDATIVAPLIFAYVLGQ